MSRIAVAGAGAFGTSLAIALATKGADVTLWGRDSQAITQMQASRKNTTYLPEIRFPDALSVTTDTSVLTQAGTILIAIPTQKLRAFGQQYAPELRAKTCVLCCKGIEQKTGLVPSQILASVQPDCAIAVLTGPGFASEIARGLPTALTLAQAGGAADGLQALLSTPTIRLYQSDDPLGAQLGGALKNVFAIACGIGIGAGLGESARAAVMTRGYAEMVRLAVDMGAKTATLSGLSGLGDLALTCTSLQSRNFSLGHELGRGGGIATGTTFEGVATARATMILARRRGIDMPLTRIVTAVLERTLTIPQAVTALLSRPLKSET